MILGWFENWKVFFGVGKEFYEKESVDWVERVGVEFLKVFLFVDVKV